MLRYFIFENILPLIEAETPAELPEAIALTTCVATWVPLLAAFRVSPKLSERFGRSVNLSERLGELKIT